eukprot:510031-Amorphochlora_amoeboformis.AAC.1
MILTSHIYTASRHALHLEQLTRALVPGCGRGYDALLLSEGKKRYVVGMDISETAIKEAQAERREMKVDAKQVA